MPIVWFVYDFVWGRRDYVVHCAVYGFPDRFELWA